MILLLLIILGFFTLAIIFIPAFVVSVMKLTILAVFCYIITNIFMKHREISYLIIMLYAFSIITMGAQFIAPKIESIEKKLDTIEKVMDRAEKVVR